MNIKKITSSIIIAILLFCGVFVNAQYKNPTNSNKLLYGSLLRDTYPFTLVKESIVAKMAMAKDLAAKKRIKEKEIEENKKLLYELIKKDMQVNEIEKRIPDIKWSRDNFYNYGTVSYHGSNYLFHLNDYGGLYLVPPKGVHYIDYNGNIEQNVKITEYKAQYHHESLLKQAFGDINLNSNTLKSYFGTHTNQLLSKKVIQDVEKISNKLTSGKKTDKENIKQMYDWIIKNIAYDRDSYNDIVHNDESGSPKSAGLDVFYERKGLCSGISRLLIVMIMINDDISDKVKNKTILAKARRKTLHHAFVMIGDYIVDPTLEISFNKKGDYFLVPYQEKKEYQLKEITKTLLGK